MPKRDRMLGSIQVLLLSIIQSGKQEDAYAEYICIQAQVILRNDMTAPQVGIALRRMYSRGLLQGASQKSARCRGKFPKVYALTKSGKEALAEYLPIAHFVSKNSPAT